RGVQILEGGLGLLCGHLVSACSLSGEVNLVQAHGHDALPLNAEDDLPQGTQLPRRALDPLARLDVKASVVAMASQRFTAVLFAGVIRDRALQVRALLQEGDVLATLTPDQDCGRSMVGVLIDEPRPRL